MTTQFPDGSMEFRFTYAAANRVFLVGDFNAWDISRTPMMRDGDKDWVCRLHLPNGFYEFLYWADGQWFRDYVAFGLRPGPFGWNSILCVREEAKLAASAFMGEAGIEADAEGSPPGASDDIRPFNNATEASRYQLKQTA